MTHPQALYRPEQVRELDRRALKDFGVPGYELMGRAGAAAWAMLHARWPQARRIGIACGPGNNGGDGYVLARLAKAAGLDGVLLVAPGADPRTPDAPQRARSCRQAGGSIQARRVPKHHTSSLHAHSWPPPPPHPAPNPAFSVPRNRINKAEA